MLVFAILLTSSCFFMGFNTLSTKRKEQSPFISFFSIYPFNRCIYCIIIIFFDDKIPPLVITTFGLLQLSNYLIYYSTCYCDRLLTPPLPPPSPSPPSHTPPPSYSLPPLPLSLPLHLLNSRSPL